MPITTLTRHRIHAAALVALFFLLYYASTFVESPVAHVVVEACRGLFPAHVKGEVPPEILIALCCIRVALVFVITAVIARIERRSIFDYGLRGVRIRQIGWGALSGSVAISAVVGALWIVGGLEMTGVTQSAGSALIYAAVWAAGMLLVGLSEEMEFRGVPVLLLARCFPVWVPVVVSAAAFALAHMGNEGENWTGLSQIALFGAVTALSVVRTGSLAWAIGFHAGWNWTLEYLFGAVGSGYVFQGHLLSQVVSGPEWLTGGKAGLEGSLLSWLVLIVVGIVLLWRKPSPLQK
jgi:membrane protease YdiL (CAAX protease family)